MINGHRLASNEPWILHTLENWLRIEHRITLAETTLDRHEHRLASLEADKKALFEAWTKLLRGCAALMAAFALALALNGGGPLDALQHLLKRSAG